MKTTQTTRTLYLIEVVLYNLKFAGKWHSDVKQTWYNATGADRDPADLIQNWTDLTSSAAREFTRQFIGELLDQDEVGHLAAHFRTDPNVKAVKVRPFAFPADVFDDQHPIPLGAIGFSQTTSYAVHIDRRTGKQYGGYFCVPAKDTPM